MNNNEEGKLEATKILEEMKEQNNRESIKSLIEDNKIEFSYEDTMYRVRVLNLREKEELSEKRLKKFTQLIQDKDILLEKDLIKVLKEVRNIDVENIIEQIKKLGIEELDLQFHLGESISKNESEGILKSYKDKIEEIQYQRQLLNTQKMILLDNSLENQLLNFVAEVITYLSLDICVDEKWQRRFKNLDEFKDCEDTQLVEKAGMYSMILNYA